MRARFVVEGIVQGVGFRSLCRREATALGLAGFVRNLADGSVEVFAEGPEQAVTALAKKLESIHSAFGPDVKSVRVHREGEKGFKAPSGELKNQADFEILF